jgi:hypothetical protein
VNTEDNGWIVKLPYTTNGRPWCCDGVQDIIDAISSYSTRVFSGEIIDIPYAMIQAKMANNYEAKVVCFNMTPMYISKRKRGYGQSIAKGKIGTHALLAFAGEALNLLHERCPAALLDGLVRVDIFRTCQARGSRFVVNEFESLEADYSGSGNNEAAMDSCLTEYWTNVISKLVIAKSREQLCS